MVFMLTGLGHELHQKALEKAENEKLEAIRIAEQAVREEAEHLQVGITKTNVISGKKTNRGPVAQCPKILGWAHKNKCLGAQLAPEKGLYVKV